MNTKKIDNIVNELLNNIKSTDSISICVGAGLSVSAGMPSWEKIFEDYFRNRMPEINEREIRNFLRHSNYKYPLGLLDNKKDQRKFFNYLREYTSSLEPTNLHQILASFPARAFITTNFDSLIEKSLVEVGKNPHVVISDKELPSYSKDTVPVVKLYGSIDQNNGLIISQSSYRNIENKYSLDNLLRIVLSTSLVIFVGFSLNDEFFSIFEQYRRNTSIANNWIFISPPGINSLSHNLWMKRGINILQIDYDSMIPFFKTFRDKILETKTADLITKKKRQIFISSSSRNLPVVRRIRDVIKESSYNPVSVFDLPAHGQTLFEKFEKTVRESEGAIILLEEDEMSSRLNTRKIRDNVLLELGYLLAHLGKDKLLILTEGNVEMPSDLSGVQFFVANSSTYRGLKRFVREWLDNMS